MLKNTYIIYAIEDYYNTWSENRFEGLDCEKYIHAETIKTKISQIIFKHWHGEIAEYTALIKDIDKLFEDGE